MANKKALMLSIAIFIIVGLIALSIVLGKGHIASYALVKIENVEEEQQEVEEEKVLPKLEIDVDKKYLSSVKKESAVLSATIDGEEVTEGITYKSSDETIAKIKDGKVTAVKNGKVTITATYEDIESTVDIHVITPIKSITFTTTNSTIRVGKDLQMKLQASPSDADITTLKYTSSDEEIATVNSNGIVTGVSAGKVKITVKDEYSGIEKSVNLTIRK